MQKMFKERLRTNIKRTKIKMENKKIFTIALIFILSLMITPINAKADIIFHNTYDVSGLDLLYEDNTTYTTGTGFGSEENAFVAVRNTDFLGVPEVLQIQYRATNNNVCSSNGGSGRLRVLLYDEEDNVLIDYLPSLQNLPCSTSFITRYLEIDESIRDDVYKIYFSIQTRYWTTHQTQIRNNVLYGEEKIIMFFDSTINNVNDLYSNETLINYDVTTLNNTFNSGNNTFINFTLLNPNEEEDIITISKENYFSSVFSNSDFEFINGTYILNQVYLEPHIQNVQFRLRDEYFNYLNNFVLIINNNEYVTNNGVINLELDVSELYDITFKTIGFNDINLNNVYLNEENTENNYLEGVVTQPSTGGSNGFFSTIEPKTFFWLAILIILTLTIFTPKIMILKAFMLITGVYLTMDLINNPTPNLEGLEIILNLSFIYIIFCFWLMIKNEQEQK